MDLDRLLDFIIPKQAMTGYMRAPRAVAGEDCRLRRIERPKVGSNEGLFSASHCMSRTGIGVGNRLRDRLGGLMNRRLDLRAKPEAQDGIAAARENVGDGLAGHSHIQNGRPEADREQTLNDDAFPEQVPECSQHATPHCEMQGG